LAVAHHRRSIALGERCVSQQLKQLSESLSTLKGTARGSVGFSLLSLLDNGFSRWRWGGIETSALLH